MAANPKATSVALVVSGGAMYVCYVDEAGCTGALPGPGSAVQPVFTIAGLMVRQDQIAGMTNELIQLKKRFYPNLLPSNSRYHDWMNAEIKGSEIRKLARSSARNNRRFAYSVIHEVLQVIASHDGKIVGRVFIKQFGQSFNGTAVYSSSVQRICADFQNLLATQNARGLVIADSRNKAKNANISHSIFTQWYSANGNPYPNLIEVPSFGHSDNHAGLQLCDMICSALLFPIAAELCCLSHMTDLTHCHAQHSTLRTRYGQTLRNLQYRYSVNTVWLGGIHLSDPLSNRHSADLFT
ncbi:MAG: DUF3800 domain-containing protein [Candidatus Accumulibacter sp.]|nr:DUF3800 domain-containing protein [Accumulibacter sp.]